MTDRLALHTWSLDTTPLAEVLRVARITGWPAVELRRADFDRAVEAGQSPEDVVGLVRASGLRVACVGAVAGWMFAEGEERRRLLRILDEQCGHAAVLGCPTVMSPTDSRRGDLRRAADSVREVADIATRHGVRLAIEANSQAEQLNSLRPLRELLALAGSAQTGLLVDTYHLCRSGAGRPDLEDLRPEEIVHVQFSDVPATGLQPGRALDRLPPGRGVVPFRDVFAVLREKGYAGWMSYEAPNPVAWARDPVEVAGEALGATHSLLGRPKASATSS